MYATLCAYTYILGAAHTYLADRLVDFFFRTEHLLIDHQRLGCYLGGFKKWSKINRNDHASSPSSEEYL